MIKTNRWQPAVDCHSNNMPVASRKILTGTNLARVMVVGMFLVVLLSPLSLHAVAGDLQIATFEFDASPPIGGPLAYDPCVAITDPLSLRGVIFIGAGEPIVLAVVDWLGVANEAHQAWRKQLAAAVGTRPERVALHAVHQHDAPRCDLSAASLLAQYAPQDQPYDVPWIRDVIAKSSMAARESLSRARPVNGVAMAAAEVREVASNRRLLGPDGRVAATRYTACADPKLRALPTGTVDPLLRTLAFYQDQQPIVVLTYFATHPQSYYRTGEANPDFVGYARNARQATTGIPHVHFNGAGGNVGAGKWNDGNRQNRQVLADKVTAAMQTAFSELQPQPLTADDIGWRSISVALPLGEHLDEEQLIGTLTAAESNPTERLTAAKHLAWLRRTRGGEKIDLQCLRVGRGRVLHMPGELFVEYQLEAAAMRPDLFVAMAAYGEYGPGYIGTQVAYAQGGYETSGRASRVGAGSEAVLIAAIAELLRD